jgi:hypothetical protein
MTSATGAVQIDQSVIDGWTAAITAETANVTSASANVSAATGVLGPYIQQLLAGQATPLPDADVANINAALTQLQSADAALATSATNLQGLEPAPAPPSAPVPVVTAVADTSSGGALADAGGDNVTVTGSGFSGATAVNFGATPATSFTINSDTEIVAVSPAGPTGTTVDITVVTPAGTSAVSAADQLAFA